MEISINDKQVAVIGYGSVGRALTQLLHQKSFNNISIFEKMDSAGWEKALDDGFQPFVIETLDFVPDLTFLAVSDLDISTVSEKLARLFEGINTKGLDKNRLVFHLSGRMGLEAINPLRELGFNRVAFHPIQTFPEGADYKRFNGITIGVTQDPEAKPIVSELVKTLDLSLLEIAEENRADYHLASVLASNFLPILLDLGAKRLVETGVDYETAWKALMPLVKGMVESMGQHGPHEAATGPVIRDDFEAIAEHSKNLNSNETDFYIRLTEKLAFLLFEGNKKDQEQYESWKRVLKSISEN